jgi:hypothetical protein
LAEQVTLNYSHNGVISAALPNTLPKFWLVAADVMISVSRWLS